MRQLSATLGVASFIWELNTAKITNITKNMRRVSGFFIVMFCAVVLHSSCARKVVQSMERTRDTLIVYKTDSVMVRDTIVTVSL